jgi:hypothetical protein
MKVIDRRTVLTAVLCGAAVTTLGLAVAPSAAEAIPLAMGEAGAAKTGSLVEKAVVVVVHPRRRGRRWRCWWHRGRRVCGWRW